LERTVNIMKSQRTTPGNCPDIASSNLKNNFKIIDRFF